MPLQCALIKILDIFFFFGYICYDFHTFKYFYIFFKAFLTDITSMRFNQNRRYIGIKFASISTSSYVNFCFNFNFIPDSNFNYFSNFNLCPLSSLPLQRSNFIAEIKSSVKKNRCSTHTHLLTLPRTGAQLI